MHRQRTSRTTAAVLALALLLTLLLVGAPASAQNRRHPPATQARGDVEQVERIVVRWHARSTGGAKKPQFISARELAFEARLEALSDGGQQNVPFTSKQLRSTIQRHVTESILARLPVDPAPSPKEVARYAEAVRGILAQRIGGGDASAGNAAIDAARRSEAMTNEELDTLLRRRARASWYLDKMVAPMLEPSELDLREVHKRGESPFTNQRFEKIEPSLRQWYVSGRMNAALEQYYRTARTRVDVILIGRPGAKRAGRQEGGERPRRRR